MTTDLSSTDPHPLSDPLLREQNISLSAITDQVSTSRATLKSFDQMIADAKAGKAKEAANLARLLKHQKIMRKAVFDLASVQQDMVA